MEKTMPTKEQVIEAIKPVKDPEMNISVVDLGLIYDVKFLDDGKKAFIEMTLTSPGCPVGPQIMAAVHGKALEAPGIEDVEVKLVWTPKWDPKIMASEDAKDMLGIF